MAAYETKIPNDVLNIINVFISKRREDKVGVFIEGYKDLIASLYSLLPNKEAELTSSAWMYGVDLYKYLSNDDIGTLMQNLPSVMRYCFSRRNEDVLKTTRTGAVGMPDEFIELFLKAIKPKEGATIFLPYAGDAEIVLTRPDCHFAGFEIDCERWAISKMVFNACGIESDIRCCPDAKEFIESGIQFDYIFTFPPMGGKEERKVVDEMIQISNGNLEYNGVMFCYLPVVFCKSQTLWYDFREEILGQFGKYSVINIALGSVLKPAATIGICAFCFTRDVDQRILLMDATGEEFRAKVDVAGSKIARLKVKHVVECIEEQDERYVWSGTVKDLKHPFNLYPGRYLLEGRLRMLNPGEKRYSIGDLVELCVLKRVSSKDKESVGISIPAVGMKDLYSNYISCDVQAKAEQISYTTPIRVLEKNALLIGYINGRFKVGKVLGIKESNCVILQQPIVAINVISDMVSEEFLLRSILSDEVRMQAEAFATGSVASKLSERDLLDIQIVVPSKEEQYRLCSDDASASMSAAEKKIQITFDRFRDDIHMKKHAIGQTILSLNSWWKVLEIAHDEGLVTYNPDAFVDDEQGITVKDVFDNLYNGITQIQSQINRFDRGHRLVGSDLSISRFVNNYIETHRKPEFQFEFFDGTAGVIIVFPQEALSMILDDIISNACCHGFRNEKKMGNLVRVESSLEGTDCIVRVSNNGMPLSSDISEEDVFTYNRTGSSEKNHSGIGGYEVRNLMQQFDGEVEFLSNPGEEFPVCYKLLFHNTKNITYDGE